MKGRLVTVMVVACLAVLTGAYYFKHSGDSISAPPIEKLQAMGHLASLKVNYANVIEFDQTVNLGIPWTVRQITFGGTKVLLVAKGECLVGTDLRLAKFEDTNLTQKTITLVLPSPSVISTSINHDSQQNGGSYFYSITNSGVVSITPGLDNASKAVSAALAVAQTELKGACLEPRAFLAAKKNGEEVMQSLLSSLGWKVRVVWRAVAA